MTQSDNLAREATEEGNVSVIAMPGINAGARAPARDTTPPPAPIALQALTEGAQAARRKLAAATAKLDKPDSLFTTQPLTFQQAHAWHHQSAGHHDALLIRVPRLLWGYFHLLIVMPLLRFLEWVLATPSRFLVAVALAIVIWHWS